MVETSHIEALLRLQDVETTIRRLERRLEELPEQAALDAATATAGELRSEHDAARVDLELLDAEIRRAEGEISLLQQRRDAERSRMYGGEITQPKELQALRAEIDSVERRIGGAEETTLELMERREEIAATLAELGGRLEELVAEQERLTSARDDAAKEILAGLAEARVAADAERASVPDDLAGRYEASKRRHGGIGIGRLDAGICTACHFELTPLERSDARDDAPLTSCPQCQRLLAVIE